VFKPEVTIGIPFRDPGPDFVLALKSVFAQSHTDWELLLCNDGSKDNSLALAQSLDDPRVRVTSDGQSRGLAPRLNQMVALARGEFFFRMDADDIMHPGRVKQQLATIRSCPDIVTGTAAYAIDAESRVIGFKPAARRQRSGFGARHSFFHPTLAASVHWFRENRYSEQIFYFRSEDAELYCRTTGKSRFVSLPDPLMFIREVGVFSYRKHIATSLGVLSLIEEYGKSPLHRAGLLTRELTKIWLMLTLDAFGKSDLIVKRRGKRLSEEQCRNATEALSTVFGMELPISQKPICQTVQVAGGWRR
jgi:glycosyltransferase involved in cell wall biosynthesis